MELFLNKVKLSLNSVNSANLINHWSMNRYQFKDPLCYLYLHGAVVSSLSLLQEVVGSRLTFYKKFINEFTEFSHLRKTPLGPSCHNGYLLVVWIFGHDLRKETIGLPDLSVQFSGQEYYCSKSHNCWNRSKGNPVLFVSTVEDNKYHTAPLQRHLFPKGCGINIFAKHEWLIGCVVGVGRETRTQTCV